MKLTGDRRSFGSAFSALVSQMRDELLGLAVGQRLQQDGVHDAEDRGRGTGAETERGDRDRRERRRTTQLTPREAHVAAEADPPAALAG